MRIVFMGTPTYAVPVLESALSGTPQLVGVYTQPDKPAKRGRVVEPTPVKSFALERNLDVFQPQSLRRSEVQAQLAGLTPDVILVAAYGKILPPEVLAIPRHGCINVHPSLLPRYRGASPVATAILEGDSLTGTTLMLMDEGMDTGPILASRQAAIDLAQATTESLTPALFELGADLLKEVLPGWINGDVRPSVQDSSKATVTRMLEKGDGEVDWHLPAEELERHLRAFTPWPGLFSYWQGKLLKILSAVPYPERGIGEVSSTGERDPGTVVSIQAPGVALGVVTGDGVLGLRSLQVEGRRAISAEEFLMGYRDFVGSRLPS